MVHATATVGTIIPAVHSAAAIVAVAIGHHRTTAAAAKAGRHRTTTAAAKATTTIAAAAIAATATTIRPLEVDGGDVIKVALKARRTVATVIVDDRCSTDHGDRGARAHRRDQSARCDVGR